MRIALPLLASLLAVPALAQDEECVDYAEHVSALEYVEPKAIRGALSDGEVTCLELGYLNARSQTDKSKISRVLLANAYMSDTGEWARLVRRHLDEVEQSDPDIAYLYANYLFNRDDRDLKGVVRFSELAFENRQVWEGDVFTARSHHLLRLRSVALLRLWEDGERAAAGKAPNSKEKGEAEELRVRAHAAAREWLDFDRNPERDAPWFEAAQVCISTANESACGLKPDWRQRAGG